LPAVRFVLAVLALSVSVSAQLSGEYVRRGAAWVRLEQGQEYALDARVVSVRFRDRGPADGARLAALADEPALAGLQVLRSNRLGIHDLLLPAGRDPLLVARALAARTDVEFVEPAVLGAYVGVPDDPSFGTQWNLENVGQAGGIAGADVHAVQAWDIQDGAPSVVIAVLDSGTEWTHPDLAANIWSNPGDLPDGLDNDGNGFADDVHGWDFDGGDNNPAGLFFHGTFVAGCVAASSNNTLGVAGLAGGASDGTGCRLMICNVGSLAPNSSVLDDALIYAADNGARIITMSLAVPSSAAINAAVDEAVDVAGAFIDCASGNNGFGVSYPATLPKIMAVASSNRFDAKSAFSNAGPEVEVAAPGEAILSTNIGGGYTTSDGTSFAAPHVAALAGLLLSQDAGLTASEVRTIIRDTADDIGPAGFDTGTGFGRINAHAALLATGNPPAGAVLAIGQGVAGFGGLVPQIDTRSGVPEQGDLAFGVVLSSARPDAPAYALVGLVGAELPFEGGTLYVDVFHGNTLFFLHTTSAAGTASRNLPIPDDPVFVGLKAWAQWVVVDPAGPAGYAFTQGLELTVGP